MQRAGFAGQLEKEEPKRSRRRAETDYEECLACQ